MRLALTALLVALMLAPAPATAGPAPLEGAQLVEAWPGLAFNEPVQVAHAGDGTDTLYVLEIRGVIKRLPKHRGGGPAPSPTVVLDLTKTGKVQTKGQGGVLGMAFHPKHADNGLFYLSYLAGTDGAFKLVVAEYRMANGACDVGSERIVIEVPKTRFIHQAGGLAFGPDGMLYVGVGDDGAKNDKDGNAQNPGKLLGKILRLDVSPRQAYAIPGDNPWAKAAGVRPELWAYGFRNPWRLSFGPDGTLWVGEPGTGDAQCREWFTAVQRGGNHGWPFMEGNNPNPGAGTPPNGFTYVRRAFEYARPDPEGGSCGIGGRIYTGARLPALAGKYVFADYELGEIYCVTMAKEAAGWTGSDHRVVAKMEHCVSIDADAQGELYLCRGDASDQGGTVYTLVPR
ncbi:MAG: PQQ-dependent sugar dehydrogenase [Planctomycetia bacterium]